MTNARRIQPGRIEVFHLSAPIETPVQNSFAAMTARPAVFLRIEDDEGAFGWGEIWCNHPAFTAEHRAHLAADIMAPRLIGNSCSSPSEASTQLAQACYRLAVQCAEQGPHAQVLAGFDAAMWDLAARRAELPLHQFLTNSLIDQAGGSAPTGPVSVPAYGSGINPVGAVDTITEARETGFQAFKMKVGFGRDADLSAVQQASSSLEQNEQLMLDANQGWDLPTAIDMAMALTEFGPGWLEEPILADAPPSEWAKLAETCAISLAGGENLLGDDVFSEIIEIGHLSVIQPDVAKWGGVSGCFAVGRRAVEAGHRYCPHFLGGAVGLAGSAHLLAAVGGSGVLEVDVNPNPLRQAIMDKPFIISDGAFQIPDNPGIGFTPDPNAMAAFQISHTEVA